jgi:hypothetical protein
VKLKDCYFKRLNAEKKKLEVLQPFLSQRLWKKLGPCLVQLLGGFWPPEAEAPPKRVASRLAFPSHALMRTTRQRQPRSGPQFASVESHPHFARVRKARGTAAPSPPHIASSAAARVIHRKPPSFPRVRNARGAVAPSPPPITSPAATLVVFTGTSFLSSIPTLSSFSSTVVLVWIWLRDP